MIRWFINLLYGSEPVEFHSSFGLSESIDRLRTATERSVFHSLKKQSAVGTVTENKVSLQRVIPMIGNSFKPFFVGRFEVQDGKVVLAGRFTTLWLVKAFMTFWFGFCTLWTVLAFILTMRQPESETWWFPLFGTGLFLVGVVFVRTAKWLSRNDTVWLSSVIQSALAGTPPNKPLESTE